ncbi:MAG: hypothetical protein EA424_02580 [Planctomycetaceae bacterium]|nr:MAG: hypothetical protein EA424_02580 [Planctomycetaceae bacterium]
MAVGVLQIEDPARKHAAGPVGRRIGFDWLPYGGLQVTGGAMLGSPQPAEKIVEACHASDELTIEAWVIPARVEQPGPNRCGQFDPRGLSPRQVKRLDRHGFLLEPDPMPSR